MKQKIIIEKVNKTEIIVRANSVLYDKFCKSFLSVIPKNLRRCYTFDRLCNNRIRIRYTGRLRDGKIDLDYYGVKSYNLEARMRNLQRDWYIVLPIFNV